MPKKRSNKQLILTGLIFCTALTVLWFLFTETISAAGPPLIPPETTTSFWESISKGLSGPLVWIIKYILLAIESFLILLTNYAALILNNLFQSVVRTTPVSFPAVIQAWGLLRDIANSIFILIVIWIALTIVLSLEQWGGRKLLIRVVLVALLVNFSLAIVTAVFGFTNFIAYTFVKQLPSEVGTEIIDRIKLQSLLQQLTPDQVAKNKASFDKNVQQQLRSESNRDSSSAASFAASSLAASVGIQSADAQLLGGAGGYLGCGILLWVGAATGVFTAGLSTAATTGICLVSGAAGALIDYFSGWSINMFDRNIQEVLLLLLSITFLLITLVTFIYAVAALFIRFIASLLIAILSPAAFLMFALPGNIGQKYWNQWTHALFQWSFFAPAFYFLLYITIFMLQQADERLMLITNNTISAADPNRFIVIFLGLAFMIAAYKLAKQTGGAIADAAIGWGKTAGLFALGAATGGVAAAGAVALRRTAWGRQAMEKGSEILSRAPAPLRPITVPVSRAADRFLEKGPGEVAEHKKELDQWTDEKRIANEYYRSSTAPRKAAAAIRLAELGKLGEISGSEENAINFASRFNMERSILKVRPDLVTKHQGAEGNEAIEKFTEDLKYNDLVKIDKTAINHKEATTEEEVAKRKQVLKGIWLNPSFSPYAYGQIAQTDLNIADTISEYVDELIEEVPKMTNEKAKREAQGRLDDAERRFKKYYTGETARGLAVKPPSKWEKKWQAEEKDEDEKKRGYDRKGIATSKPEDWTT